MAICGHVAGAQRIGGKNGGGAKELIALRTDIGRPRKNSRV
jgi:hypothetical protein